MPQEQQEKFETVGLGELCRAKGTEKKDYDPRARQENLVRTFQDETGLKIHEEITTAFDRDGGWDGMASHLTIESGGEVVYEESGGQPVINKPGEWSGHIKKLIEGVRAEMDRKK